MKTREEALEYGLSFRIRIQKCPSTIQAGSWYE